MDKKREPHCPCCGSELLYMGTVERYEETGVENDIYQCPKWDCKIVELRLLLPIGLYPHVAQQHIDFFLN